MSVSYTKTVWVNGEAPYINDDNLNHIEQGIADVASQANTNETAIATLANDVDTRIDGVDATLATKEAIDTNTTYVKPSSQVCVIKKHGFVHMWTYCMNKTLAANTWYTLVTVASDYRPKEDMIYGPATIGNNAQYPGLVRVGTDGKVEVFCHTAVSGQLVVFNIMYAV